MKAKRILTLILPLLIVLAQAVMACAATEGGAHGDGHGLNWGDFLWRIINFIIFVAIIWKFAGKKIADFFRGRREEIETKLTDLSTRREEAEQRLKDVEESIANLEQEKAKILEDFKSQGEAVKAAIIQKAEEEAEKMKAQAEYSIEQERRSALKDIRFQLADMVVSEAEDKIKGKLSEAEHKKLIDQYLTKVVPS